MLLWLVVNNGTPPYVDFLPPSLAELRRARCTRLLLRERAHHRQPRRPVHGVKALDRSSLEVLHIHVAHHPVTAPPPRREISWQWQRSTFQHRHLKELVLAGFERMLRQISLVRYLARVCKSLERVALLKDWCVREMGL